MAVSIALKTSHVPLPSPALPPTPPSLAPCSHVPDCPFVVISYSFVSGSESESFRFSVWILPQGDHLAAGSFASQQVTSLSASCSLSLPLLTETLLSHVKLRRAFGTSLCLAQALTAGGLWRGDGEAGSPGMLNLLRCRPFAQEAAFHVLIGKGRQFYSS